MMFLAVRSATGLPSLVTASLPVPASRPCPSKTVTLFFFIKCLTPALSWPATARLRFTIFGKSIATSLALKP